MIDRKTTGMLLDELVTNSFKEAHFGNRADLEERRIDLCNALAERGAATDFDVCDEIRRACIEGTPLSPGPFSELLMWLVNTSRQTWDAQERVMGGGSDSAVAEAAKEAQRCNALRSQCIRDIDSLLWAVSDTITEKTYG